EPPHGPPHRLHAFRRGERVVARGAEDGAAEVQDSGDAPSRQALVALLDQARVAVANPHDLEVALVRAADDGADHRVEAWTIAPAGEDAHLQQRLHGPKIGEREPAREGIERPGKLGVEADRPPKESLRKWPLFDRWFSN